MGNAVLGPGKVADLLRGLPPAYAICAVTLREFKAN